MLRFQVPRRKEQVIKKEESVMEYNLLGSAILLFFKPNIIFLKCGLWAISIRTMGLLLKLQIRGLHSR